MMRAAQLTVVFGVVFATGALVGCKGETVVKADPQTQSELDKCVKDKADKDKLIKTLQDENAAMMRDKQPAGGEIVVAIEGTLLTVKPGKPGAAPPPLDDKAAAAASKDFLDVFAKSRGGIQKCYEQALKKNSNLQARTITLRVSASFSNAGAFKSSSFDPPIDATFDTCMKTLSAKWVLPQSSPAMTFRAQVSLTPS